MSLLAHTAIWDPAQPTDLGQAFQRHLELHRNLADLNLPDPESVWLNAIRNRARQPAQEALLALTDEMLTLLANPSAVSGGNFRDQFTALYDRCALQTYPLAWALRNAMRAITEETRDYTLGCFDLGMIRVLEDEALVDSTAHSFVKDILARLDPDAPHPPLHHIPAALEDYSEALVYLTLKRRGGGQLTVRKISDPSRSNPDFECHLQVKGPDGPIRVLHFFIEVKTLNIVDAQLRLRDMRDDALDAQVELQRQADAGHRIAVTSRSIAPYHRYVKDRGVDPDYDAYSVRLAIDTLTEKAASAFKLSQFQRGPTFALASLLRLPLPGQGTGALAPYFYDPLHGGACVSGALWHVAFGSAGAPIHRTPEFEGAGTLDGTLARSGILVDSAVGLPTPALLFFNHSRAGYHFQGLYDANWTSADKSWCNLETETILDLLCDDFNDRENSSAYKYALPSAPP